MEKIKLLLEAALKHQCDVCGSDQDWLDNAAAEAKPEIEALTSKVVYLAHFVTGEYDDRFDEIVKIFSTHDKANTFVEQGNLSLKELGLHNTECKHDYEYRHSEEVKEKFGFSIDYTGAHYYMDGPYTVE